MQTTVNYSLKKPEGTDVVNIDDFNTNADIIDSELAKRALKTEIPTIPVTSVNGKTGSITLSAADIGAATVAQGSKADSALQTSQLGKTGGVAKQDDLTALNTSVASHLADYTKHPVYGGITTGTANTYAITLNPALTNYADGVGICVRINVDSTGASTINVNGLGAKGIKKANGTDVTNLKANGVYTLRYNSTTGNFILQGEGGSGNATASDLLSGKTASTDAGDITGTLALAGTAVVGDVASGKTFYNTDAKTIQTGTGTNVKQYATGTTTSSSGTLTFTGVSNAQYALYYLMVSGLAFTPKVVALNYSPDCVCGSIYSNRILNKSSGDGGQGRIYCNSVGGDILILDNTNAYVNGSGFRLPAGNVYVQSKPFTWEAWG